MTSNIQQFGETANHRSWLRATGRGLKKKCPQCGVGAIFSGYSKIEPTCSNCGLEISGHQADDAPPDMTIMIVGHITIPLALATKQLFDPPMWLQFSIWGPIILAATFWLLPITKGGLIGLQWANRMHGFRGGASELETTPIIGES